MILNKPRAPIETVVDTLGPLRTILIRAAGRGQLQSVDPSRPCTHWRCIDPDDPLYPGDQTCNQLLGRTRPPTREEVIKERQAHCAGEPYECDLACLLPPQQKLDGERAVFCGALEHDSDIGASIVLMRAGMEPTGSSCVVQDYVTMICWGPIDGDGFLEASALRDAAVSVFRAVKRQEVDGKVIHSVTVGEDRSQLDPTTSRPYIDIELTVVSDIRRFRQEATT